MSIAILGAGNVGAALGERFAAVGHKVFFGVPQPNEPDKQEFAARVGAQIGTVTEAARDAEIIVLAVPFDRIEAALDECGDFSEKVIVDATNPLQMSKGGLTLSLGFTTSGGEKVVALAKGASVVKCFNQTSFANLQRPQINGIKSMMFVCGDDKIANETVRDLAAQIGFDALDVGDMKQARVLEPLAVLWIHLSYNTPLKRDFAFAIVRK